MLDIYIPSENKIIEVKSRWWWDINKNERYCHRLSNNLLKRGAVINCGYKFQLWIFEDTKPYRILENDEDF